MGIFDKFSKKEPSNKEEPEFEEYIEDEQDKKMPTTFDKVDLSKLDEAEFEAYVKNPNIFEMNNEKDIVENKNANENSEPENVESYEEPSKSELENLSKEPFFARMKVKFSNKKSKPVLNVDDTNDYEAEPKEDAENKELSEDVDKDEIPLEQLSLDELEKLYDEDSSRLEDKTAIEDLTGVVSLRGLNKRFERLSEKEDRRKEQEREKKKTARRKLMNGTFAVVIFGGVFYFTYAAFEEPINTFTVNTFDMAKTKVVSIFNSDVQDKMKGSVEDVITKKEKEKRLATYGNTFPKKIDVDKTPIEDFTIPSGNYIVGEHIPEGNYLVEGKVSVYESDVDLKINSATASNDYQSNILHLSKGTILSLDGTMYPNVYRSASLINPEDIKNGVLYEIGKDIKQGSRYYLTGFGKVEYFDKNIEIIDEKAINNTKTIEIQKAKFVKFTDVDSFKLK